MANEAKREYPTCFHLWDLEPHYSRHVGAMTSEGLHEKSKIAAQLAWRDKRIAELEAPLAPAMPSPPAGRFQAETPALARIAAARALVAADPSLPSPPSAGSGGTGEWVKCSVKPKPGQLVIAFHPHATLGQRLRVGVYETHLNDVLLSDGFWHLNESQATHWMPLPSPPAADPATRGEA